MVPKVPVGSSLNSNAPNTIPYVDVNYTFLPYQLTSNRYLPSIKTIGDTHGKEEIKTNSERCEAPRELRFDEASFEGINEKG